MSQPIDLPQELGMRLAWYKRQSKNVQKWELKNVQFYSFNTSFKRYDSPII